MTTDPNASTSPNCCRAADGEAVIAPVQPVAVRTKACKTPRMSIADEKYIAVQTFKRNGDPVSTPCWITGLGDHKVGFWTSSDSFKYKRLKNDPRITIQPSDVRGRPKQGTDVLTGSAVIVTEGAVFDAIMSQVTKKYGVMVPISKFANVLAHIGKGKYRYGNVGVVVTLDA